MSIEISMEDLQELVEKRSPSLVVGGVRLRNVALLSDKEYKRYRELLGIGVAEKDEESDDSMSELLDRYAEFFILLAGEDTPKVRKVLEGIRKVPGALPAVISKYFEVTQVGEA